MNTALRFRPFIRHCAVLALWTASCLSFPVQAQQATPLSGALHISGATAVDPPPNQPKNTHAGITIKGPAALRLFRTMQAKAEPDACMDKGWRTKFAGPMFCSRAPDGKNAKCFLTVSLIDGTTHSSRAGC